jgi:hypothetical protein
MGEAEFDPFDIHSPQAVALKATAQQKALMFAQKYLVFDGPTADLRAQELLAHWTATVRRQRVSPSASAQELAYWNARREFVEAIHAEIEFANNGLAEPTPRIEQ